MVGKLAKKVRETHPGIEFQLSSSNFALPAMDRVMRGAMEIGLGRWNFIPEALESRTVANERLVVALHEGHRLSRRTSLVMADLAGEPLSPSPSIPAPSCTTIFADCPTAPAMLRKSCRWHRIPRL